MTKYSKNSLGWLATNTLGQRNYKDENDEEIEWLMNVNTYDPLVLDRMIEHIQKPVYDDRQVRIKQLLVSRLYQLVKRNFDVRENAIFRLAMTGDYTAQTISTLLRLPQKDAAWKLLNGTTRTHNGQEVHYGGIIKRLKFIAQHDWVCAKLISLKLNTAYVRPETIEEEKARRRNEQVKVWSATYRKKMKNKCKNL